MLDTLKRILNQAGLRPLGNSHSSTRPPPQTACAAARRWRTIHGWPPRRSRARAVAPPADRYPPAAGTFYPCGVHGRPRTTPGEDLPMATLTALPPALR